MTTATVASAHLPALDRAVGWIDARAVDVSGRRLGRITAVLCDAEGRPWWLVVRAGFLRRRTFLAAFDGARPDGWSVRLAETGEAPRPHDSLRLYEPPAARRRGDCPPPVARR